MKSVEVKKEEEKVIEVPPRLIKQTGGFVEILDGENRIKINGEPKPLNSFKDLSSSSLANSLRREYSSPTVIKKYCIPSIVDGKDLICKAPTGMGKTICFLIPIIEN